MRQKMLRNTALNKRYFLVSTKNLRTLFFRDMS